MTESGIFSALLTFGMVFAFAVLLMIAFISKVYIPFKQEQDYLRDEIQRSTGRERKHWEKALKRLYIRQIPLVGAIILRRI